MKKLSLIVAALIFSIPVFAVAAGPFFTKAAIPSDTACRDTSVCLRSDPFNLNLLCVPPGGIYYGSQAIVGDQFNPVVADTGANTIYHGFVIGNDTLTCCVFKVTVADTVSPAGDIRGNNEVCAGETAVFTTDPIAHATFYLWSYSGSSVSDSITFNPSLTLVFDSAVHTGTLTVKGMNDLCARPGQVSDGFFIHVRTMPVTTIRNPADTLNFTDTLCGNSRSTYYVAGDFTKYQWAVNKGEILGDSLSRYVTIDWDTVAGKGSVSVSVEDQHGCRGSSARSVIIRDGTAPDPSAIWLFGYCMLVCSDSTVDSYQWYYDDIPIQNATGRYYLADTASRKSFTVETCHDDCCNRSSPFYFTGSAGMEEAPGSVLQVYPNPSTGIVRVRMAAGASHRGYLLVSDCFGRFIRKIDLRGDEAEVDLTWLWPGLYFLKHISDVKGVATSRLIKL